MPLAVGSGDKQQPKNDGPDGEEKARHESSTHRAASGIFLARERSIFWIGVLPAAAVAVTDVWFPPIMMGNWDLQLAVINITGAFLDGFFAPWESGQAQPKGVLSGLFQYIADDMRGFFLSTYTSWSGMVVFAAALANQSGSLEVGLLYMILCIGLGIVAHGMGTAVALIISAQPCSASSAAQSQKAQVIDSNMVVTAFLVTLVSIIVASYILVATNVQDFSQVKLPDDVQGSAALIPFLNADDNKLLVSMIFSIGGALTGNLVGNLVDAAHPQKDDHPTMVPRGTLVCNTLFSLLALSLPVLTLRQADYWKHSVLLQSFAGSFCGAASAFAGHASDNVEAYNHHLDDKTTVRGEEREHQMLLSPAFLYNIATNLIFSALVFLVAFRLDRLVDDVDIVDENQDGIVEFREIALYYQEMGEGQWPLSVMVPLFLRW